MENDEISGCNLWPPQTHKLTDTCTQNTYTVTKNLLTGPFIFLCINLTFLWLISVLMITINFVFLQQNFPDPQTRISNCSLRVSTQPEQVSPQLRFSADESHPGTFGALFSHTPFSSSPVDSADQIHSFEFLYLCLYRYQPARATLSLPWALKQMLMKASSETKIQQPLPPPGLAYPCFLLGSTDSTAGLHSFWSILTVLVYFWKFFLYFSVQSVYQ